MKTSYSMVSAVLISLSIGSADAQPLLDAEREVLTYAPIVEKATAAVVNISTLNEMPIEPTTGLDSSSEDHFFKRFFENIPEDQTTVRSRSLGSGVIIDADQGHIVTTMSVTRDAKEILVKLQDGREYEAEFIGQDEESELMLLRIEANNLASLSFTDSSTIKIGDVVFSISSPFGFEQTVTAGIVSNVQRAIPVNDYVDFIQTDAALNPGSAGGPLINSKGEMIGINHSIYSRTGQFDGIGFALPANIAAAVVEDLIRYGEVQRGWLGLILQPVDRNLLRQIGSGSEHGALVTGALEDGPGADAGIQPGDVILTFNNLEILNPKRLVRAVGMSEIGEPAKLTIWRQGQILELETRIEKLPDLPAKQPEVTPTADQPQAVTVPGAPLLKGVVVLSKSVKTLDKNRQHGIQVLQVAEGSKAWLRGLRRGDIVVGVNRRTVASLSALVEQAQNDNNSGLLLEVLRDNRLRRLRIK
ncbi:MAG: trypsin-like peptidase domain-containing protein [Arenicellales bacterium]|nr:trypsin-like peptidase domain-containing protein [Arenicellales bacterium]